MKKRIIALILCLAASVSVLAGCAGSIDADSEYKGQQITMYMTENIYNLDPAYAYTNEISRSIISLLFDTLFVIDENGNAEPSLAESYKTETVEKIKETDVDRHYMYIELKEGARWSDNQPVTADDVVFAWKRVLNPNNSFNCAHLLFAIKNAKAYNRAEVSKDDVGLSADGKLLTIEFEEEMSEAECDQFLLNLTSLALAPLREDIASKNEDWAKKPGIMTSSGPFKLSKLSFYKHEIKNSIANTLFSLGSGYSVASGYTTETGKDAEGNPTYKMYIQIRDNVTWADGNEVLPSDVIRTWEDILDPDASSEYASLLYNIKNAKAYNEGTLEIGSKLGLAVASGKRLEIEFESKMTAEDYKAFAQSLTNQALAPSRKDAKSSDDSIYMISYEDSNYSVKEVDEENKVVTDKNGNPIYHPASEPDNFEDQRVSSFILERNLYYYRNAEDEEKLDVSVVPYRILVDCSLTDEEILDGYNNGIITYVGDIPLSIRNDVKEQAHVSASLSTNSLYINQKADIAHLSADGTLENVKLFAIKEVRQALSMVINRQAIAEKIVFAEAATGIVPTGAFDTNNADMLFRDNAGETSKYLVYTENESETKAKELLASLENKIIPEEYYFTVTVSAYDEVHLTIAEEIVAAWNKLGFNVTLNKRGTIANNDHHKEVGSVPTDLCDDLWAEDIINGNYDVALLDIVAATPDPLSVLAPFSKYHSGQAMDMSDSNNYQLSAHPTGFNSDVYNALMNIIFDTGRAESKSAKLHRAEDILMEELPVIPVVFNQSAYLINEDVLDLNNKVLFWETANEYVPSVAFEKISVKEYEEYELKVAKYIYDNFDEWKTRNNSYFFINFASFDKDTFVHTNSNYFFLFKDKYGVENYEWIPKKTEKNETTEAETDPNE